MIHASPLIGIAMTTKDRWDDLAFTLGRLQDEGLNRLETVVIDDGSATPRPVRLDQDFPWVKFVRFESSQGLIVQRNRLARLLSTPYILGIDDDSFPIAGSLEAAVNWMSARPKVIALALWVSYRNETLPVDFEAKAPFPVRDFIGCANLINREAFLAVGGYEERFEFFTEEAEFGLRAIQQGYEIHAYPAVVVQHNLTMVARNMSRRCRQFMRNEILIALWFFPFPESWLRALRALPVLLIRNATWRRFALPLTIGAFEAPFRYLTWPKKRQRFTKSRWIAWRKLPTATESNMGTMPTFNP